MTIQEAEDFIHCNTFVFANSYAKTYPHEYLQRTKCNDVQRYEAFIQLIRDMGKVYFFHSKQYIYLQINKYVYWEMGRPIPCVQVLNRAASVSLIENAQEEANGYITETLKNKLKERELYLRNLLSKDVKSESDYRQIKFLMNTERRIHGGGHNIIDNYLQSIKYE
jgi:hypothetical protein